jgi:hypothetical protein
MAVFLCLPAAHAAAPAQNSKDQIPARPQPSQRCERESPDYVAGVDVHGRPVVPADLPSETKTVIGTEVYPELKSRNRQLNGTGLAVRIEGLGEPPRCPLARPSTKKANGTKP